MTLKSRTVVRAIAFSAVLITGTLTAAAAPGVTFHDIAAGGGAGLAYNRAPSTRLATLDALVADGFLDVVSEYPASPYKPSGAPGVAVLDYDGDGDLDIYVTN